MGDFIIVEDLELCHTIQEGQKIPITTNDKGITWFQRKSEIYEWRNQDGPEECKVKKLICDIGPDVYSRISYYKLPKKCGMPYKSHKCQEV